MFLIKAGKIKAGRMVQMMERLQKIIAASGLCSRRDAEELLTSGRVTLNGQTAQLGQSADGEVDIILVDGVLLKKAEGHCYIMLNKPRGYLTAMSDDRGRQTVAELVTDLGTRVFPVGRLDLNSEGLLLMTDDGALANRLMHPSHGVKKTYQVRVQSSDIGEGVQRLCCPMTIDGTKINIPQVKLLKQDESGGLLSITIDQGLNRQVRKMCAAAGFTVLRLRRVAEGGVTLGNLPTGKWRFLTAQEIAKLQK